MTATMRRTKRLLIGALALVGILAIVGISWFFAGGVSARQAPGVGETRIARALRHRAIPRSARRLANPFPVTPDVLREARGHFADHCASCHGNDGKGATDLGRGLYPRVPDMTLRETQSLSDGEMFFIIKNGVRLTGMPAWGTDTPEDDRQSWHLVAFIRALPRITEKELEEMKAMNPVSAMDMKEEKDIENFLEGGHSNSSSVTKPAVKHGHR